MKDVLRFRQDPAELAGGDVDAQLVQLFPKQRLGDVLVVILVDDEGDQVRPEVAGGQDLGGQVGHQVLAVGSLPAFAAVEDDLGTNDEILDHEVFITFEDRFSWLIDQRDEDLIGNGQLGGLGSLGRARPHLPRLARLRGRSLERTGRDDRPGLESLEAEDLVFQFRETILQMGDEVEQLPHERRAFRFRDIGQG